jgi:hypothetical protein
LPSTTEKNRAGWGNAVDPVRVARAEELFIGVGDEPMPLSTRAIEKQLCAEFDVTPRTARKYMQIARQNLVRLSRNRGLTPEAIVERADARFNEAFQIAKKKGDASSMVQCVQRQAELHGVTKREVKIEAKVSGLADALASVFSEVKS